MGGCMWEKEPERFVINNVLLLFQHVFALEQRDQLIRAIQEAASSYVGISIKQRKEPITFEQYQVHRLGKYRFVIEI